MAPLLSIFMTKILGLDVSSASTGHCVINNGRLIKSSLGTINPDSKKTYGDRLKYFAQELSVLLKKHKPDKVIIEDIFKGPNVKTLKTLAMFRGVCFLTVFNEIGQDPICIMPTEARKLVGVGGTSKEDGFNFVIKKYAFSDYEFDKDNDITDAIVLGLSCYEMEKQGITEKDLRKKKKKKRRKRKK